MIRLLYPQISQHDTYDGANRLMSDGTHSFSYDTAGRMTSDGVNGYTWDRASRLLSMGSSAYLYNGLGQRVQQTVSAQVTQYLLDTQPGLWKVLAATQDTNTTRYVHGPTGIQEQQNPDTTWRWPVMDGLGSVRGIVDSSATALESQLYDPYGSPYGNTGGSQTVFGFTGEPADGNGLVQLRARYYSPMLGVFTGLDPLEGASCTPMSLNRYAYVQGNVINAVDPSGLFGMQDIRKLLVGGNCALQLQQQKSPSSCAECQAYAQADEMSVIQYSDLCAYLCQSEKAAQGQGRCTIGLNQGITKNAYRTPQQAKVGSSNFVERLNPGTNLSVYGRWGIENNIVQVLYNEQFLWIDTNDGVTPSKGSNCNKLFLMPEVDPASFCMKAASGSQRCVDLYQDSDQNILAHVLAAEACSATRDLNMNYIGARGMSDVAQVIRNIHGTGVGKDNIVSVVTREDPTKSTSKRYTFVGLAQPVDRNGSCWQDAYKLAGQLINGGDLQPSPAASVQAGNVLFYCAGGEPEYNANKAAGASIVNVDRSEDGSSYQMFRNDNACGGQ